MKKKSVSRAPAKKAAPKAARKSAKSSKTAAPAPTGMWKILEHKKLQQKQREQARSEGRVIAFSGSAFQPHERAPRFVKFAGPRRKVG